MFVVDAAGVVNPLDLKVVGKADSEQGITKTKSAAREEEW